MTELIKQFNTKIKKELKDELKIKNELAVPRLQKIVINAGIGKIMQSNPKQLDDLIEDMTAIAGQRPVKTRAKKAISAFKIREKQIIGLAVTLRGQRMIEFFEKLVKVALPRSRDFRGLPKKGFDGHGNYTLGLRDHTIFAEMTESEGFGSFGLEVVIVTTAANNEQGYLLLKKLGFPFKD